MAVRQGRRPKTPPVANAQRKQDKRWEQIRNAAGMVDEETLDRAWRAVGIFRRQYLPLCQGFARALTGNQKIRVEVTGQGSFTDGETIYLRPPMALADMGPHDRHLCHQRDEDDRLICNACDVNEQVIGVCLHEIAHIVFDTFKGLSQEDVEATMAAVLAERAVADGDTSRAAKLRAKVEQYRAQGAAYSSGMGLAAVVSPFLPHMVNCLEDARVNRAMFGARAGAKRMFYNNAARILENGLENNDGTIMRWNEQPMEGQLTLALLLKASGYDKLMVHLDEKVQDIFATDDAIKMIVMQARLADSPQSTYRLAFPFLEACRAHGYFKRADDEKDDEPEQAPEENEKPEVPQPKQGDDTEQDAQPKGDGDETSDDECEDGDPGEGQDGDDDEAGDGESDDQTEGDEDGDGASGDEDEGDQDSDEAGEAGGDESGDQDSDEDGQSEGDNGGGDASDEDGDDAGEGGEGEADEDSEAGDGEGEDGEDGEADGSGSGTGTGTKAGDDGEPSPGGSVDLEDDDDPEDGDADGDGDPWGPPTGDAADDPEDGDPDDGEGEDGDADGSGQRPADETADEDQMDENALEVLINLLGGHGGPNGTDYSKPFDFADMDDEEADAVELAVSQDRDFDAPSVNVPGVRFHRATGPKHPSPHGHGGNLEDELFTRSDRLFRMREWQQANGVDTTYEPPEAIIGKSLMKARIIFSENRRTRRDPGRKSGRPVGRHLHRVAVDNPNVFSKKHVPNRRDYFVLMGIDASGSGVGFLSAIESQKRAVMAMGNLLHRVGVPFVIVAHTGDTHARGSGWDACDVDLYVIRDENDPWGEPQKNRLRNLIGGGTNVDGHTLEQYRKWCDRSNATDKIILYFTDGAMPATNYEEELEILQREIETCRKRGYALVGVGMGTDSPTEHGLDTVQIDSVEDIPNLIAELEKRITVVVA